MSPFLNDPLLFDVWPQCKAIAGAVLGDGNKMERVIVDSSNPYDALSNQEADVATTFSKFAMDKDIFQVNSSYVFFGFSFCLYIYICIYISSLNLENCSYISQFFYRVVCNYVLM